MIRKLSVSAMAAILLAVSLTACVNNTGSTPVPDESLASENPATTKPSSSEFSIPENFPSDIPLLEGEIVLGSVAGESPNQTWAIEVIVANLDDARVKALSDLQNAGFSLINETGISTDTYEAMLTRSDYDVRLKIYLESDTGELEIRYVVTPR